MKVHRIGGSLMITIPAPIARRMAIEEGDDLELEEHASELVVRTRTPIQKLLERWEPLPVEGRRPTLDDTVDEVRRIREGRHL